MKTDRRPIFITSLCILLPVIAGALLWKRLPEQIPTHFNWTGAADGWSGKTFAVFGLPLFLLAIHLSCIFVTRLDPKRENINGKIFSLVLWICPAVSLFTAALIYPSALGYSVDAVFAGKLLTGLLLVSTGNYLPKCRQNYTVGIKLPWTLADEENWNRTHRLAGPVWVAAGLVILLSAFVLTDWIWITSAALLTAIIIPVIYSAALHNAKRRKV